MTLNNDERTWMEDHFTELRDMIGVLRSDVAVLKFKAGIWGIIGGAIPVLITIGIYLIFKVK